MAHASQVKNVFSWEWEDDGGSAQPLLGLRPSRPLPPHPPKSQQADPRTWCVTFWCLPLHSLTLLCPVQPKRECPSHSSPIQSGVSGVGIWGWGGGICGQAYTLSPVTLVSSCTTDSACVYEGIPHAMPEPLCKVQRGLNWFLLPLNKVLSPCTLHTCGFKDSDNVLPLPLTWVSNNSTPWKGGQPQGDCSAVYVNFINWLIYSTFGLFISKIMITSPVQTFTALGLSPPLDSLLSQRNNIVTRGNKKLCQCPNIGW